MCVQLLISIEMLRVHRLSHAFLSIEPRRMRCHLTLGSTTKNVVNTGDVVNHQRRVKKNKYEQFSSHQIDPLQLAIEKAEKDQRELETHHSDPVRGTTVPTIQASNNVTKTKDASSFRNVTTVVPSDPLTFGYVEIGMILGPHGVKGEMRIQIESDFSELRVSPGSILYVRKPNRRTPRAVKVLSSRKQSDNTYLVFLHQINSRLSALAFKRYVVYVKEKDRPVLQDDEYLIRDVVGMKCYLFSDYRHDALSIDYYSNIIPIGAVVGIIPPDELCDTAFARLMHAQLELELFTVTDKKRMPLTNDELRQLCLVPFVPSIVPIVDVVNQCLFIDPPIGLLDMTYNEKLKRVVIRGYLPEFIDRITADDRQYLRTRITYS